MQNSLKTSLQLGKIGMPVIIPFIMEQEQEETHTNNPIIDKEINELLSNMRDKTKSSEVVSGHIEVIHGMFGIASVVGVRVQFMGMSVSDGIEIIQGDLKSIVML